MIEKITKEEVRKIVDTYPKHYSKILKKKQEIIDHLESNYPDISFKEQIFCLLNNLSNPPVCLYCSNACSFKGISIGYNDICKSTKCRSIKCKNAIKEKYGPDVTNISQIPGVTQKKKETTRKRYGVDHHLKLKHIQEQSLNKKIKKYGDANNSKKRKQTCLEKYGVDNPQKLKVTREKVKQTKEAKYGSENYNNRDKAKQTNLERYGKESHNQVPEIKDKQTKTLQEHYGEEYINPSQVPKIREKIKQTNLERYGVEHISQSEEIQRRKVKRYKEQYGVESHTQRHYSEDFKELIKNKKKLELELTKLSPLAIAEKYAVAYSTVYNYILKLGIREKFVNYTTEEKIKNILLKYDIEFLQNDRKQIYPKELDFYIPSKKIAIEVCGLYWHSENGSRGKRGKKYHLDKMNNCEENGIGLITIFDDELSDMDKIEHRLTHILNLNKRKYHARKLSIYEITSQQSKEFLNKYHTQNNIPAPVKIGAFHNNELVGVMSFGKTRKALGQNSDNIELLRFASKYNIPGLANRLFSYYIRNYDPEKIISYCDLRWGTGELYKNLGFDYAGQTSPNYWYMENHRVRNHRYKFIKSKLINICEEKDIVIENTDTEWDLAQKIGLDRIWDCGSSKWVWTKHQ